MEFSYLAHGFHFNATNIYNDYSVLSCLELFSGVLQTLVVSLINSI